MKRFFIVAMALSAILVSCNQTPKGQASREVGQYDVVTITPPDLTGITDNGKEVLNLYRFAADEIDNIYWDQYPGDRDAMNAITDPSLKEYAMINYGPWDRLTGQPFIDGYGPRPAGAGFYPADMTREEFEAFGDTLKNSPYTLIRRTEDGKLKTVWFHDEYKDRIEKICNYLQAAADITIKPSVRNYLLKKIDALRTDNYYESELAWLDMVDSKMDLVIGPNEGSDDQLFGIKKAYSAFVLLKDLEMTDMLQKYVAYLPELQKDLPCDDAYKTFRPGVESDIFAYKALYYAGQVNAGVKVIAINLPTDPKVQEEKGTRTILLRNIMEEKFNRIVHPTGVVLLESDYLPHLDADAFFWNIACREVAHGLGVKETVNGKGTVEAALGNEAAVWERAKANIVGLYLACELIDKHAISALLTREDAITTFIANLLRSERFGEGSPLGRANIMMYNYLSKNGAFHRNENGKYSINFDKATQAIRDFAGLILKVQATGDYEYASAFEKEYSTLSPAFKADQMNLHLEHIPVDLTFNFKK